MRKITILSVFALVLAFADYSAFAQTSETQNEPAAASQEDIRRLENQLSSTRRQMIEALQSAANQSVKERKEISNRYEAIISSLNAEIQRSERQASEREARLNEDRMRQERNFRQLIGGVIIAFVVIGFLVLFFFRKSRTQQVMVVSPTVKEGEEIPKKLFNPEKPDIRRALEKKPEQLFDLLLPEGQGRELRIVEDCTAKIIGGEVFVTRMNGKEISPVAWDKRRQSAAKFVAEKV